MAYATIADMLGSYTQSELIERTNLDDEAATAINAAVLNRALEDAHAEIDGYLGRYNLPFVVIPTVLKLLCRKIARKNLYFDAPSFGQEKPQWRRDYEDSVRILEKISTGDIDLGTAQSAPHPSVASKSGNQRVFTRTRLAEM